MMPPRIPANEAERLRALESYRVMDTPPEELFDDLTMVAAEMLDMPIALISLVDAERQWFKSRYGLDDLETPRDVSFCGHVVGEEKPLVVNDALKDERFSDNPLVTGEPRIRFYAGFPLRTEEGHVLGTLCAIDHKQRTLTKKQQAVLKRLAAQTVNQLETRRKLFLLTDYERLFDSANVLPAIADFNGYLKRINKSWSRLLGYTEEELLSRPFVEFVHEDDVEATQKEAQKLGNRASETVAFTNRCRCADGSYKWLLWHATSDIDDQRIYAVAHDDTPRRNAQDRLEHALTEVSDREARLSAVVGTAVDAIITIDAHGIIDTVNPAVESLFGYAASELIGQNVRILMPSPDRERHDQYLANYMATGDRKIIGIGREVVAQHKDGTPLPVELAVSEVRIGDKPMFTGILRDISERKRIERMKSEFVATVSHELRTPLTSIRGSLGLLAGGQLGELSEGVSEMIQIAMNNSDRLVRLVNDILDIEKIESGRLEFRLQQVNLSQAVQDAVENTRGFAADKAVRVEVQGELAELYVQADPDRLAQVLANLLSNALKFSPSGEVVDVSLVGCGDRVRVTVRDRGPGVPEAFRSKIFQRFAQADSSDTRKNAGTGLGLSIAKAIVDRLGGTIGFGDADGGGATFFFELPVATRVVPIDTADAYARVLVCEDEPDIALLLRKILNDAGCAVDVAANVAEVRAHVLERTYSAITLDLKLGEEDGIALLRELRDDPTTRDVPVVVISAVADEAKERVNGAAVMVTDWICKPIDGPRLALAVKGATNGSSPERRRILHVEDDPDLARLIPLVLSDIGTVTTARTLDEAKQAMAAQDYDVVLLDLSLPDGEGTKLLEAVGDSAVIIFSARDVAPPLAEQVAAALVKSRSTERDLRQAILRAVERDSARPSH
jgi:PAS domain S-box-containing protein